MFILGDFSYYHWVTAQNFSVQVLTELYAENNENTLIMRADLDGFPVTGDAFVRSKFG